MKIISTLFSFFILTITANSQQWKLTSAYSLGLMQQEMKENIQPAHSLQLGILYQLPQVKRLSLGLELGIGSYANKQIDQTFQFDNNTSAVVPVNYTSNVFNANLQGRLNLVDETKFVVTPYINAKAGLYNFFSSIYIEDPDDPLSCRALEHESIINDKTLYWSAGGGLQIDLGYFSKKKKKNSVVLDLGANVIRGGTIDYINTKDLVEVQTNNPMSKPVSVDFINASTQSIHEHTVAQLYSSPLRMLEIRAGVVINLNR
ncbi:MAG TPA: hypothetical protein VF487_00530 [Chitinophagaceae bacterium]